MSTDRVRDSWRALRKIQPFNWLATRLLSAAITCGIPLQRLAAHLPVMGVIPFHLPFGKTLRLHSHGDDYAVNLVFWTKGYEAETFPLFCQLAGKARCTVDIGAHVGIYALAAACANPPGTVYAFEPLRSVFDRLQENVRLNGFSNVRCVDQALGERSGVESIFYANTGDIPSNSSLRGGNFQDVAYPVASASVTLNTLDQFVKDNGIASVDLVKIDTEGTELEVLRGMSETLRKDHPDIICEVLPQTGSPAMLEEFLRSLGYQFYRLEPAGPRPSATIQPHAQWWNHYFTTRPLPA